MKTIHSLACALACAFSMAAQAAQLTYDIRFDAATSSPGVVVVDAHHATVSAPGDVVGVLLYTVIANFNSTNADDGFVSTTGSFVADSINGGGLVGDLRGDTTVITHQNNVPGADHALAQSGFASDLNGDGGLDVGDITNTGPSPTGGPPLWFVGIPSDPVGTLFGSGATPSPTEILVGRTTFTVKAGAQVGQSTQINYQPRMWLTGGTVASRRINKFRVDGVQISLASNDANVATVSGTILMAQAPLFPKPAAITGNTQATGPNTATVTGTVNPRGSTTTAKFQVGVIPGVYDSEWPVTLSPADGTTDQAVSAPLTGLTPLTTYHYRLVATNAEGTTTGEDKTFNTTALTPQPPAVVTGTATNIGTMSVTLHGTVNAQGDATTAHFESGITDAYGINTSATLAPNDGVAPVEVSANVDGLLPGTTYHFRVSATNSAGTSTGADVTFTTSNTPNVLLTYEMRIDPATTSAGVVVTDAHHATASAPGNVVGMELYAVIANFNGNNADDGFIGSTGSFLADSINGGGLVGNLRGDTAVSTNQNNVPGADFLSAQSGFAVDLNGDGGLDVGDITNQGPLQPGPVPWFVAMGGTSGGVTYGTGATAGPTEILIGRTTFTVGAGGQDGQATKINYAPRMWLTGGAVTSRKINKVAVDGVAIPLASNDPNVAIAAPVIVALAMQPAGAAPSATTLAPQEVLATNAKLRALVNANGSATTAKFQSGLTTAYGTETPVAITPADGTEARIFSAKLANLAPNTTYHYRIVATNSGGTTEGADMTFTTPAAQAPTITGPVNVWAVSPTSVTFKCLLNPNGSPTTAVFQSGTTKSYGTDTVVTFTPVDGGSHKEVSATITGLAPDTAYHVRLSATNQVGTVTSEDMGFRTMRVNAPNVTTFPATTIGASTATLNASVGFSTGQEGTAKFEYGLTTDYGSEASAPVLNDGSGWASAAITGLTPGTTYHYRISATNNVGTSVGSDMTFMTLAVDAPQPPYVSPTMLVHPTYSATNVTARFVVYASPNGLPTTAKFEIGTTINYGTNIQITEEPFDQTTLRRVTSNVATLQPNTTYHCRFTATNAAGTTYGEDTVFTTEALLTKPVIGPATITGTTETSADVSLTFNPGGLQTLAYVEYGTTTSYGQQRTIPGTFLDHANHSATVTLLGLTPNTTYHYRVTASNQVGKVSGVDGTFTTLPNPIGLPGGAWLTYEMRIDPANTSPGVIVSADRKAAQCPSAGDVVALQLFAIITNSDGNHANDGFMMTSGSFYANSADGLIGNLRGDTTFTANGVTKQNNVPGADAGPAQSGFAVDLNGDGGLDVGDLTNHGPIVGPVSPWFTAISGTAASPGDPTFGTGTGDTPTEILIGQTTYTVAGTAQAGQSSKVNYVPRLHTTGGTVVGRRTNKFVIDGIHTSLASNEPKVAVAQPVVVTFGTPAPADSTPPTIDAPAGGFAPLTLTTGANGLAELPDYTGQAVTGDNVGVTAVTQNPPHGGVNVGVRHVVLTAHDAAGNTAETAFDVTVLDGTAPFITHAPGPISETADAGGHATVPDVTGEITATDNVGVAGITQAPAAGSSVGIGQTEIVVTVADAAGNTSTASVTLNVVAPGAPPPPPADRGRGFYSGLLNDGAGSADGLVTLEVGGGGGFSGKVSLHGVSKGFLGVFRNGAAQVGIPGFGILALARNDSGGIGLTLGDFSGLAEKSPYSPLSPAPMRGAYTVLLPPDPAHTGDAAFPQGTGFATLKVNVLGLARCVGRAGDSASFAFASSVHADGTLPCYDGLYLAPRGSIAGTLTFRDLAGSDLDGTLAWSKPAQKKGAGRFQAAPDGFGELSVPAIGSRYRAPGTPVGMLDYNKTRRATVSFHDGGLAAPVSATITVRAALSAAVTPPIRELVFSPEDGTFFGTLKLDGRGTVPGRFLGVVFQKQNRGAGFFLGARAVGAVDFAPQP